MLGVLAHNLAAIALYRVAGWQRLSEADLTLPDGRVVPMHCFAAPEDN